MVNGERLIGRRRHCAKCWLSAAWVFESWVLGLGSWVMGERARVLGTSVGIRRS
jgi:hypothetical protein